MADRSRNRRSSRLARDRSGQSEVLGVVLLLGIVVVGTGAIVLYGGSAIGDTQRSASLQRAEHTMTLFDSRVAMVALGDTDRQTVAFSTDGGSLSADDDAGWIRVVHHNHTASSPPRNETIYNASLGSVRYTDGDTTIAYQGGGVWRTTGNTTEMVSPPEFHFRAATLTLPVVRVENEGGAGGSARAVVTDPAPTRRVFPNVTAPAAGDEVGAPYNGTDAAYDNPVSNGTVTVTVHSRHYKGWAQYFRSRTDGEVSVDHDAQLATVELQSPGVVGFMPSLPSEGNAVKMRGVARGHPLDNFTVVLRDGDTMNGFKRSSFSLYASSGNQKFEVMVYSPEKQQCDGGSPDFSDLQVHVLYENGTAHHEWVNTSVSPSSGPIRIECVDYNPDHAGVEPQIVVDFTGDVPMNYTDSPTVGGNNNGDYPSVDAWHFDVTESVDDPGVLAGHPTEGEPLTFEPGPGQTDLGFVVDHYVGLLGPNVDFTVGEYAPGNSERVIEADSYGTIDYERRGAGDFLTFLHITENAVRVAFN